MWRPAHTQLALVSVAIAALMAPCASAKHVHVPKKCPVKPHACSDTTVFSTPDADSDVVPGFVGKKGQPLNSEMDRVFAFDPYKLLGNLTEPQKKQIRDVNKATTDSVTALQEQINTLNQKLDVVKAHSQEHVIVQESPLPTADELKAQIADLRKSIAQKRKENSEQVQALLTDQQRDQIQRMRRGEIMHEISENDRKETQK